MWQKIKDFFAPLEEEKDYSEGWDVGYNEGFNDGWDNALFQVIEDLEGEYPEFTALVQGYIVGKDD